MTEILSLEGLFTGPNVAALVTLAALEIILGIDNIIFIAILVARLPKDQQASTRQTGLWLAMGMRIALLLAISWVMRLTQTVFEVPTLYSVIGLPVPALGAIGHLSDELRHVTGKDLILIFGGLFLIAKSTWEIHDKLEGDEHGGADGAGRVAASVGKTLVQIMFLDIVFSLDSVITAVGMAQDVRIMILAVVMAVLVMMVFAGTVSAFVERHPTVKMLALSFLLLIGVTLVSEGFAAHVGKGYIYFAMCFSLGVEMLNIRVRTQSPEAVRLRQTYIEKPEDKAEVAAAVAG